jgi:hypothetical protein
VALGQLRGRVEQERKQHAAGLGQVQRALQRPRHRPRIAQRSRAIASSSSASISHKDPSNPVASVEDRRQHVHGRLGIVLGKSQTREHDPHLARFAELLVELRRRSLLVLEMDLGGRGGTDSAQRRRANPGARGP